ncbi:unnamed protein product [Bursaphelenchus xylophilus]|uniref:(pine wood nematode) hypothetical protein n=1 Tax=Bursaphelenchus xylophilus TaxID=6326 RepID=A0A1I7S7R0_BURXY|nr:unnamed protein product [Bursaphelenchus xylophilus]CAG9086876.1 unnamed protein product [Bursaphelenchus xylophilus]
MSIEPQVEAAAVPQQEKQKKQKEGKEISSAKSSLPGQKAKDQSKESAKNPDEIGSAKPRAKRSFGKRKPKSRSPKESEAKEAAPEKPKAAPLDPERAAKLKEWVGETWTGTSEWFNVKNGFGFIKPTVEDEEKAKEKVFVHFKNIRVNEKNTFASLGDNEKVEFTVGITTRGLQALDVRGPDGAELEGHHIRPLFGNRKKLLKCYNCGKYGHKGSQCKEERLESACYWCKEVGHKAANCPEAPKKGNRKPSKASAGDETEPTEGAKTT